MREFWILCCFLFVSISYAQDNRHEKIKAMKTAYITEQLELSSEEAEKFWPIYNKHRKDFWEIRVEEYKILQEYYRKDLSDISETKAKELLAIKKRRDITETQLHDAFLRDLQKAIPSNKIFMLHKVEEGFKRRLLQWYSENKE